MGEGAGDDSQVVVEQIPVDVVDGVARRVEGWYRPNPVRFDQSTISLLCAAGDGGI